MAVRRVAHRDFLEGVRALLVDKDRSPNWRSPSLAALAEGGKPGGASLVAELVSDVPDPRLELRLKH